MRCDGGFPALGSGATCHYPDGEAQKRSARTLGSRHTSRTDTKDGKKLGNRILRGKTKNSNAC